jgi:hypothetical protein
MTVNKGVATAKTVYNILKYIIFFRKYPNCYGKINLFSAKMDFSQFYMS